MRLLRNTICTCTHLPENRNQTRPRDGAWLETAVLHASQIRKMVMLSLVLLYRLTTSCTVFFPSRDTDSGSVGVANTGPM